MRRVLAFSFALALLGACGPGLPEGQGPRRKPPPKPGSSISHTQMCSCTSCGVAECCRGDANQDQEQGCRADEATGEMVCGFAVKSCVGRCTPHVWRMPISADCAAERPKECCPA